MTIPHDPANAKNIFMHGCSTHNDMFAQSDEAMVVHGVNHRHMHNTCTTLALAIWFDKKVGPMHAEDVLAAKLNFNGGAENRCAIGLGIMMCIKLRVKRIIPCRQSVRQLEQFLMSS